MSKKQLFQNFIPDDEDLIGAYKWDEANKQIELLNSLNYKGFSNWRLPNIEELGGLYKHRDTLNFSSSFYWSSTEYDYNNTWGQDFTTGDQDDGFKFNNFRVRCVRDI
jgi:hypothetical protein